jgi:glycosyltransferase involved in cell wall biosynthesis
MRVVHLLRKCDPNEWGGTETAMQRLFDGLRTHGVHPVVYCPRLEHGDAGDPLLRAGHAVRRFRAFVPVLGMSRERKRQLIAVGGNLMSFDLIPSLLREPGVGVIHTHTLGRIGGIALTAAKRRGLPFVVTIHGGVLDLPDKIRRSFNAPVESGFEWGRLFGLLFQSHKLFVDAQAILTCNEREAALLRERHPDKRIVVQPHGVPVELFRDDHRAAAFAAFPSLRGRRLLLCVGRIDPIKNQAWLVEQAPAVFRGHPNTTLALAGPCTDEPYGRELNRKIRELGLTNQILLTGGMPSTDPRLLGLLQAAETLILPSLSETFGLVLLEAWAAGAVVLASQTSGARALVQPGINGWLFDLEAPGGFHEALERILSDPGRARRMASSGRDLVIREYSVRALAGRMKTLYEQVIEEKTCVT